MDRLRYRTAETLPKSTCAMRKCEIHLPLNYRDGRPIEQEKIDRVREELLAEFDSFAEPYRRTSRYDGQQCVEIAKFEIITTDDKLAKKRLKELKERLRECFPQVDILMTSQVVQAI